MREETIKTDTFLNRVSATLEEHTGMSLAEAINHMHALRRFVRACVECGCQHELASAMERAGLGDVAEALQPLLRKPAEEIWVDV
jgi:hypothetical protein